MEANKLLAATLDSRSFITMAYAVIDMDERKMTYARAGHNPIFQLTLDGNGTHVLAPDGLGLALDRALDSRRFLLKNRSPFVRAISSCSLPTVCRRR